MSNNYENINNDFFHNFERKLVKILVVIKIIRNSFYVFDQTKLRQGFKRNVTLPTVLLQNIGKISYYYFLTSLYLFINF